jgi:phosphatidate cytidylyltransferase
MISVYSLKPAFQKLLRPVARWLHSRGVSANQVTLAALWLAVATGGRGRAVANAGDLVAVAAGAVPAHGLERAGRDAGPRILGADAAGRGVERIGRRVGRCRISALGAGSRRAGRMGRSLVLLALLSEFCGVVAVQIGASRRYDGPMGKSDRAVLLGGIALLLGCGVPAGFWLAVVLFVASGLLVLTCFNRLRAALREVKPCPLTLTSPVTVILGGVWALLLLATAVVWQLAPAPDSELRQRVRSWWLIVALCSLALTFSRIAALLFFTLVSFLALKEYLTLIPTRHADRRVLFWAYLSIPVQYYWIGIEWYGMFIIFIPVYMFLLLPVAMVLIGETQGHLRAAGTPALGLMSMVFSLSHLAFLLVLPQAQYPQVSGAGLVLFLLLLTELNDVAQYCWGKLLGKHKISPTVSPNKTVEGFVGGVVTTVLLSALLAPWLTPFSRARCAIGRRA